MFWIRKRYGDDNMNPSKFRRQEPHTVPVQKTKPAPVAPKKKGKSFFGIIISDIKNLFLIIEEARKEPDDCWENWEDQI
jgi:hypothetical protein